MVRIGDDSATVIHKLGKPTVIRGDDLPLCYVKEQESKIRKNTNRYRLP